MFFDSMSPWRNRVSFGSRELSSKGPRRSRLRPLRRPTRGLRAIEQLENRTLLSIGNFQAAGSAFPHIGADTQPGIIFELHPNGTLTATHTGQGPYDGSDDGYVGLVNDTGSGVTLTSLNFSGPSGFTAFDGDGIGSSTYASQSSGPWGTAPFGPSAANPYDYQGPGTNYTNIASTSITVNFSDTSGHGLMPGQQTFFSFELPPSALNFLIAVPPAPQTAVEGASQAFNLGSFTATGTGPWNVHVNWGDGSSNTYSQTSPGTITPESHTYAEEGTDNPIVTVTDSTNSTLTSSATFQVTVSDAALTAGTATGTGGIEGVTPASLSASFTDANTGAPTTDFSGTIDWGDGTTTPFTSAGVSGSGGSFTVNGSHPYAEEGPYTILVTVNDDGGSSTLITGSTTVADAALTAGTVSASGGVEGVTPTSLSASFTDANLSAPTSDFSGTIAWGDGNTTPFTSADVTGSGGSYTVNGSHPYAEEGPYSITVTVNDVGGSSTLITGSTTVADAALTGVSTATATSGVEGVTAATLSGATFTDANTGAPTSDFSGTIAWGDGNTTSFTSADVTGSGGSYTVNGSHLYGEEGTYGITVTVNDVGGSTTMITGSATVSDPAVVPTGGFQVNAVACKAVSGAEVATFTDPGGAEPNAADPIPGISNHYTATIDWGDGTTPTAGTITLVGGNTFEVTGDHNYMTEGTFPITVSITHESSTVTPLTVTSTATVKDNIGLLLLDPTGSKSLMVTGNGGVTVNGDCGAIVVNSSDDQAAFITGNGGVTAQDIDVFGGTKVTGNGSFSSPVDHELPTPDPLGLALPTPPTTTFPAVHYSGSAPLTLSPGTYIGGIMITGSGPVTLLPGVYFMEGGGFKVTGKGSVTGTGVELINAPSGPSDKIQITGQGNVTLTAPTLPDGTQGIAIFQDPLSSNSIDDTGKGVLNVTGRIYAPLATLNVTGDGGLVDNFSNTDPTKPGAVIVWDAKVTGKGGLTINLT